MRSGGTDAIHWRDQCPGSIITCYNTCETMPSKRAFAKRLAALAATGLGVGGPIDALTSEPPPDVALAVESATSGIDPATDNTEKSRSGADTSEPRSSVAAGTYDPSATASSDVDTVVTGRIDPDVLTAIGLPGGSEERVSQLLNRYESVALGDVRQATGGAALTADGPEGCGVVVGDVDASTLAAELDADPDVIREANNEAGFARFRAREIGSAVAVAPGEIVAAYGPTPAVAATHRDAGVHGEQQRQGTTANYGPLPSLLGGDATVCVDLGPNARKHLQSYLTEAPDELRTAVNASGAVGASLRVTKHATGRNEAGSEGDEPSVALRYGAVADPQRLDKETTMAIARAAREGEPSLSEATVTRHGRTVIVDAAAESDLFAAHASLFGATVGDRVKVTDA